MAIAARAVAFAEIGAIVCLIIYAGRNQLSIANWPPTPIAPVAARQRQRRHQTDHQAVQIPAPARSTAPCRPGPICILHVHRSHLSVVAPSDFLRLTLLN